MNISSAQWKLVLDQGHNILISAGSILSAIGFSVLSNQIVGYGGIVSAALGAILSASNVNAAVNQTPPKAP